MANLTVLSPPTPGRVVADLFVRALKTGIVSFVGVLGANVVGWTDLAAVQAAGIAAVGAAGTVILNAVLAWANTNTG